MALSQLLNGLKPKSQVGADMLAELLRWHQNLLARSASNQNWTEQTQSEFELVHAIIRHNGVFV